MTHFLYLVRHGEQLDAEHGLPDGPLSPRGRRQASLVADRLGGVPFDGAWYSPLTRAAETASIIAGKLPALAPESSALLFDCIPSGPEPGMPSVYDGFFGGVTEAQLDAGRAQMSDATDEFLGVHGTGHQLLITHNFVIAWFVREVLDAPDWRWLTINQANCGLTVLMQRPGRPWNLLSHNDLAHLPPELRTGLPEPYLL